MGAGGAVAQSRGRRGRRGVASSHQICAGGLLHRGAGGGVVEPRALRRDALRDPRQRRQSDRHVREYARGRLRQGGAPAHHDRHLCALLGLLRRLLPAGAEGTQPDQARLRAGLRQWRGRDPHAGDAVAGLRHRREKRRRPDRNVSQRRVHGDGEHGRTARPFGARRTVGRRRSTRPADHRPPIRRGGAVLPRRRDRAGGGTIFTRAVVVAPRLCREDESPA